MMLWLSKNPRLRSRLQYPTQPPITHTIHQVRKDPVQNPILLGAFHGSETFLLFGTTLVHPDTAVAASVVALWTRFAKTGNPNGGMDVTWPEYTKATDRYLDINTKLSVLSGY